MKKILFFAGAALCGLFLSINASFGQGTTAFTYQGQLHDGGKNANGAYTMIFALYDSVSNGNQIGGTLTNSATLANGLFTVNLDFGAGAFGGAARWLDITVINGGATQELTPRVPVLPAPYALYSSSAGSLNNGTWNATVGNVAGDHGTVSNILEFFDNGSLMFGLSTNGILVNGDLNFFAGGTISGDSQGDIVFKGNLLGAIPQTQVFNSSGTFVVPTGVTKIMVEVWGAGG